MADLVIRGMEMPKDWDLWLCIDTGGTVYNVKPGIIGTVQEVGTAIPLPEGHGRLGDLDSICKEILLYRDAETHDAERKNSISCIERAYGANEALGIILDAPTIVPAEGGEADGN